MKSIYTPLAHTSCAVTGGDARRTDVQHCLDYAKVEEYSYAKVEKAIEKLSYSAHVCMDMSLRLFSCSNASTSSLQFSSSSRGTNVSHIFQSSSFSSDLTQR